MTWYIEHLKGSTLRINEFSKVIRYKNQLFPYTINIPQIRKAITLISIKNNKTFRHKFIHDLYTQTTNYHMAGKRAAK